MSIFGMRLVAGEVTAEKFAKFNSLRRFLITSNPAYEPHLKRKSWAVKTFVEVFITFNGEFMALVRKLEGHDEKAGN